MKKIIEFIEEYDAAIVLIIGLTAQIFLIYIVAHFIIKYW